MQHPVTCLPVGSVRNRLPSIASDIASRDSRMLDHFIVEGGSKGRHVRIVYVVIPVVRLNEQWSPSMKVECNAHLGVLDKEVSHRRGFRF